MVPAQQQFNPAGPVCGGRHENPHHGAGGAAASSVVHASTLPLAPRPRQGHSSRTRRAKSPDCWSCPWWWPPALIDISAARNAGGQQLLVPAQAGHAAVARHDDPAGMHDRAYPLYNDDHCRVARGGLEGHP
jgi:hypothetical protein